MEYNIQTDWQAVISSDLFKSYNFNIFKAINICYMGWYMNPHISRTLPP